MNAMDMNTWLAKAENMEIRVKIMALVPARKNETVLQRWRRMVDLAIAEGYGK